MPKLTDEEKRERQREWSRKWREANPDKERERSRKWRKANPETGREHKLKYLYNITLDEYNTKLEAQKDGCAICGELKNGRALHVDHDHACCPGERSCGKCVRALLCGNCNRALGMAKESPDILRAMLAYLEQWAAHDMIEAPILE